MVSINLEKAPSGTETETALSAEDAPSSSSDNHKEEEQSKLEAIQDDNIGLQEQEQLETASGALKSEIMATVVEEAAAEVTHEDIEPALDNSSEDESDRLARSTLTIMPDTANSNSPTFAEHVSESDEEHSSHAEQDDDGELIEITQSMRMLAGGTPAIALANEGSETHTQAGQDDDAEGEDHYDYHESDDPLDTPMRSWKAIGGLCEFAFI